MVVYKQRVGICNKTLMSSDHCGPNPGGRLQLVLMRHPSPAICQNLRGGGGQLGRGGGILAAGLGGGGGLRTTHYYHMHTSRGRLGAWGYRGMYVVIAISCLCQEENFKGLKD